MQRSFTCCVGTGMESHALHGLGLYYETGAGSRAPGAGQQKLYVNVYAPSVAQWESAGMKLTMDTSFPDGDTATLGVDVRTPKTLTLALRRPAWATAGFAVRVNGTPIAQLPAAGSYVEITRQWKSGDRVELALPKQLKLERLADNPKKAVVTLGPLVMAGDLGAAPRIADDGDGDGTRAAAPEPVALVVSSERPADWLKPVAGKPATFTASGVVKTVGSKSPVEVEFSPFFAMHRRTYAAYWDALTPAELDARSRDLAVERERIRALDAATVVSVAIGDRESEKKFNQQGVETSVIRSDGRSGRRAIQWFSYDLPVQGDGPLTLVATYNSDQRRDRSFEVLVNGTRLASESQPQSSVSRFYEREYPLPADAIRGRSSITVRFEATNGLEVTPVFGVRLVRRSA
jgi:hypothetical protein